MYSSRVGSEDVVLLTRASTSATSVSVTWSANQSERDDGGIGRLAALQTHVAHLAGQVEVCVDAFEDSGPATGTDGDRLDFVRARRGPRSLDLVAEGGGGGCRSAFGVSFHCGPRVVTDDIGG